jgi:hypothetical protein
MEPTRRLLLEGSVTGLQSCGRTDEQLNDA